MKLLISLILIIALISQSSSCSGSSSSSSLSSSSSSASVSSEEQCPDHYSGPSCSIFQPYIWYYNAAYPDGGSVTFLFDLGDTDTTGLTFKIGGEVCTAGWLITGRIDCSIGPLNLYEFYDVEISNSNGVILLLPDYYSPYIRDCDKGTFSMGRCSCYTGYEGQLCNIEKAPYIDSITSSSVDGGFITAEGWFGTNPQNLLIKIGDKKIRIQGIQDLRLAGFAPQGTGVKDVTIYDMSTNQLLFTGPNLYSYDSNKCFNDCFNNGECNNGVCTCDYPYVGNFCSHTIDSSCQCSYN